GSSAVMRKAIFGTWEPTIRGHPLPRRNFHDQRARLASSSAKQLRRRRIMNWKEFFLAFIAAFIFIFLWGWFYNGVLLKDAFAEAQSLFRPRQEVISLFHWIIIGQAGLALSFVLILARGLDAPGIDGGVYLGSMLQG